MCKVTIDIESVFGDVVDAKELKEMAQSCVDQINVAYKKRLAVINKTPDAKKAAAKAKATSAMTNKATDKTAKEAVEQVAISSLTKAQIKAMGLKFEKYSDKCMFLTGNTRSIKDEIKSMNGATWNGHRQGWFVKNDTAEELAKALKIKIA